MSKRMFTVFHTKSGIETAYIVSESSEIRAIESVLAFLYGFTSKDTVRNFRELYGFTVSAEPWSIEEPVKLYSRSIGARP